MTDRVAQLVASMANYYIASGRAQSAYEINCGSCGDFAEAIVAASISLTPVPLGHEIWVDDLVVGEPGDDDRTRFDRERIAAHYPEIVLPADLSWEDMDAVCAAYDFAGGSHAWVRMDGRHYDAEAPDGVVNPLDLPYFQRVLDHYRVARAAPAA